MVEINNNTDDKMIKELGIERSKTAELFAGTESYSEVAEEYGYDTWTTDNNPKFNCTLTGNILDKEIQKKIWERVEESCMVWMSPVCITLSMAAGNTHWNADRSPKTEAAVMGKKFLDFCWEIAEYCIKHDKIFFIENPRARARWFLPEEYRKTAWYCQYGDTRAKPTDIWTNLPGWEPKTCHNFLKNQPKHCHHEAAPRGSKTGTQGLKGNMERSVVPRELIKELLEVYSHKN